MCGSTKAPPVVRQDPAADNAAAQAKATAASNAEIALRRRRRLQNSLLTIGAEGTDAEVDTPATLLAQGGSVQYAPGATAPSPGTLLGGGGRFRGFAPNTGTRSTLGA